MTKSKKLSFIMLVFIAVLAFAACTNNNDNNDSNAGAGRDAATDAATDTGAGTAAETLDIDVVDDLRVDADDVEALEAGNALADLDELLAMFPRHVQNMNSTQTGGVFRHAIVQNSPITGVMLPTHSTNATDSLLQSMSMSSLISSTEELRWGQEGIVNWEVDLDALTVTLTMRDDIPTVYWHDGVPFTLGDLLFAYEIITHPDYTGIRFTGSNVNNIVGAVERRAGDIEELTGATLSADGRQLVLEFVELPPAMLFHGLWMSPVPRHRWEGIPVAEMDDHQYARELLGFGPWILNNFVAGESYHFVPNPNYWQGAPLMDGYIFEVVPTAISAIAMQEGQFDMMGFSSSEVREYGHLNNVVILGDLAGSGSYHTFRLGTHHTDEDGNMYFIQRGDKYDNPIHEPLVRHAIGHALDQLSIAMTLGGGLTRPATSVLMPFNARHLMNPTLVGHAPNNPELANQLLDEAGLTARDEEGYRLDFNGEPWTLRWAQTPGADDDVFLAIRQQNLREAGIRMRLWNDEFVDWNFMMDTIRNDADEDMDIFTGGWSFGWSITPSGIWGLTEFNRTRWISDEWLEIQGNIESTKAWDPDFYAYWVGRWEQAFYEAAVALPVTYALQYTVVNNRVANVDITRGVGGQGTSWKWSLTADAPYAHN